MMRWISLFLLVAAGVQLGTPTQPQNLPNILWITVEDMSPEPGCVWRHASADASHR